MDRRRALGADRRRARDPCAGGGIPPGGRRVQRAGAHRRLGKHRVRLGDPDPADVVRADCVAWRHSLRRVRQYRADHGADAVMENGP